VIGIWQSVAGSVRAVIAWHTMRRMMTVPEGFPDVDEYTRSSRPDLAVTICHEVPGSTCGLAIAADFELPFVRHGAAA